MDNATTNLITACLRRHMDILITEHRATGMTYVQVSRPGDEASMISADAIKNYPADAIKGACVDALQQANTSLNTNNGDVSNPASTGQKT